MHANCRLKPCLGLVFLLLAGATGARAQGAAATYMDRYRELDHLGPGTARLVEVNNLVLTRDAGRLTLTRGVMTVFSPIGGRVVAAVFRGEGRFALTPPNATEREALRRWSGRPDMDAAFTEAVLLFADSTAEQLAALPPSAGPGAPSGAIEHFHDLVNSLKDDHDGSFDGGIMAPLLNGEASGLFVASIDRTDGGQVLFVLDPGDMEAVQLRRPVGRRTWGTNWATVTQFPLARPLPGTVNSWGPRHRLTIPRYVVDVTIGEGVSGNLAVSASTTIRVTADEAIGPWLHFGLHPKLDVDSVRLGAAAHGEFFKADDESDAWVRLDRRLARGDTATLTMFYHGTMIDREDNWFYVDPGAEWYPVNQQGRMNAVFDVTFHSPARYPLIGMGELRDSSLSGRVRTTHWVSRTPAPFTSFNLGLFDSFKVQHEGAPPLNVLLSDDAHRLIREQLMAQGVQMPEQTHMREVVAADVSNSLKLFGTMLGPSPESSFVVSEIPYGEGVSFPGLIHLSWGTFQLTSLDGFDAFFRAHEAAHQWWGNGVRPATYRDFWLSEGMATFFGLWYVRAKNGHDDEYNHFLDQYRTDIDINKNAGPVWLGWRLSTPDLPRGYDVIAYEKGAWALHMLRIMMLDLRTMNEDHFTDMLRDFYRTFAGRAALTADLQRFAEEYAGVQLDWFFDQWIKGTAVPTYHVAYRVESAGGDRSVIRFRVRQENVPENFQMPVLVAADLGEGRVARFRLTVTGGQTDYSSPAIPGRPRQVAFNDLHSVLADVKTEHW